LAVARKSMMKSAADIESNAIAQRIAACQDCASCSQPERLHHLPRIWNLELQKFFSAKCSGLQPIDPVRLMHPQDILLGRPLRLDKVLKLCEAFIEQLVVY